MVGGLGYMAGKAGAKSAARESSPEQRSASEPAPAAPAASSAAAGGSKIEQLKQLGELRDSGVLTSAEFEREKQKILSSGG